MKIPSVLTQHRVRANQNNGTTVNKSARYAYLGRISETAGFFEGRFFSPLSADSLLLHSVALLIKTLATLHPPPHILWLTPPPSPRAIGFFLYSHPYPHISQGNRPWGTKFSRGGGRNVTLYCFTNRGPRRKYGLESVNPVFVAESFH